MLASTLLFLWPGSKRDQACAAQCNVVHLPGPCCVNETKAAWDSFTGRANVLLFGWITRCPLSFTNVASNLCCCHPDHIIMARITDANVGDWFSGTMEELRKHVVHTSGEMIETGMELCQSHKQFTKSVLGKTSVHQCCLPTSWVSWVTTRPWT